MLAFVTALPMWVKVGAGMGLLLGIMQLVNWWNTKDLKRDLATTQQALKTTQEEAAKVAAQTALQLQQEEQNRLELESQIARQNARVSDIAQRARQAEAAAESAMLRAIQEGQAAADALRDAKSPVPVGHEGMNQWVAQRFAGGQR
jgi:hypothetical protein